MADTLTESIRYIREHAQVSPAIGIVLGSGLGDFADSLPDKIEILTSRIPHYPQSSVEGHKGKLIFASLAGKQLLVFQGRVHFYESNSVNTVVYPIRVAHALGVRTLIVTNAAGAISRTFLPGDLMLITDQINLTGETVPSDSNQSRRSNTLYSKRLSQLTYKIAEAKGIALKSGVYVGLKGPSYETAAEIEMIHRIGGDAVGMSTVLEVSCAAQLGMEILGISCVTNLGTGISDAKLDHAEVTEVGNRVKKTFATLISSIISMM